ncbi:hypothetical protein WECO103172_04045 [Weissella confusa]|uniref:hypothetical protein n=1 Tax=Weissella confusa TaxID=1583 RepID=UPI0007051FE2|nr:hypothetical protein [Weissella confusa]KRN23710.1 hypothetical protein IV69_GL001269 [Weissella confusa]MBJ7698560.1 hypothetical protein [Weissella confusa]MBS7550842.1 hypothetical protein [Weissella confusa]MCQ8096688.1 hypothetical protein [Weissella confusa]MCQ8145912.1 hypothetical protein [Weissella confusa]
MTKYVIDLPEGVKFIVGKGYMMLSEKELLRIPVENLQEYNAPTVVGNATVEKRVIELPDYVIVELETIKEDNGNDNLQGFMNDVNDDDEIWQCVEEFNYSGMPTDALLGEWWLEHVEFVAKKEQKFYIKIVDVFDEYGNEFYLASMGNNEFRMTTYTDRAEMFKKEEADKIISDVLNSVVALRARKVEVED